MPTMTRKSYTYVTLYVNVTVQEAGRDEPPTPCDVVLVGRDGKLYERVYGVTLDSHKDIAEAVDGAAVLAVFHVPETALPGVVEFKIQVGA